MCIRDRGDRGRAAPPRARGHPSFDEPCATPLWLCAPPVGGLAAAWQVHSLRPLRASEPEAHKPHKAHKRRHTVYRLPPSVHRLAPSLPDGAISYSPDPAHSGGDGAQRCTTVHKTEFWSVCIPCAADLGVTVHGAQKEKRIIYLFLLLCTVHRDPKMTSARYIDGGKMGFVHRCAPLCTVARRCAATCTF